MRSNILLFPVLFLIAWSSPLRAARLELRQAGTGATEISALVGEEIEVELWIDSEGQSLSGAAVFLTFDDEIFELAGGGGPSRPFTPGRFLINGEIFRNDLLPPDDPAASAPGTQIDYSVVRAADQGAGPVASFRLRALAPCAESVVRIDESGIRETRVFLPDGTQHPFRFITPLRITVQGISLRGLPARLVLPRGAVDDTTFRLDERVFDPLYGPDEITWEISPLSSLSAAFDPATHLLRIEAPLDESVWERLALTAINPDGQSATDTVDIFVAAPPSLPDDLPALSLPEDGTYELGLGDLVEDPDTPGDQLRWSGSAGEGLSVRIESSPARAFLVPDPDWSGESQVLLAVSDEFGFSDTLRMAVVVEPVNDPPAFRLAPNVRLIDGRLDSSLSVAGLVEDEEDLVPRLSWSGNQHVSIEQRNGRLVIGNLDGWTGTEEILLRAEDSGGLTAEVPLTVTVVPSLPPVVVDAPERKGVAAGDAFVLSLDGLVVDPDDPDQVLSWQVQGQEHLRVRISSSREARVEAPDDFSGTERLTFTVSDPTGGTASFDLLVFCAPSSGAPLIASLPELSVPAGGVDASLDLDEYVYDLDDEPGQMSFSLSSGEGVSLRVDPLTHVLTVEAEESAPSGRFSFELRVQDPQGHEAVQTLWIQITGGVVEEPASGEETASSGGETESSGEQEEVAPSGEAESSGETAPAPVLASLPQLRIPAGGIDQSLDLDEFLIEGDPEGMEWEAGDPEHLSVRIDPETHQVSLQAEEGWEGTQVLRITGRDLAGHMVEGLLLVVIEPDELPPLTLQEVVEVSLLAGERELRLDLDALLTDGTDPGRLAWEAEAPMPVSVSYDPDSEELVVRPDAPWQSSLILTLKAQDAQGREAVSRLFVQVLPADGSVGSTSSDFFLVAVPNVLQPEYVDLFVVDRLSTSDQTPRVRVQDGDWSDLAVEKLASGIWSARHVLRFGQQDPIEFLALTLALDQQVLKSNLTLDPGLLSLPSTPSAKRIAASDLAHDRPAEPLRDSSAPPSFQAVAGSSPRSRSAAPHSAEPAVHRSAKKSRILR